MLLPNRMISTFGLIAPFGHLARSAVLIAEPMGIMFHNLHSHAQYISGDWAKKDTDTHPHLMWPNAHLAPNSSIFFPAPAQSSPKFYIGPTPNNRTVGEKRDHDTIVEATFAGTYDTTYYDVDFEKGFSVPLWCVGSGDKWDSGEGCLVDVLAYCEEEDKYYDANSGLYDQCRNSGKAETVNLWYQLCPGAYVLPDDRATKSVGEGHGEWYCFARHEIMSADEGLQLSIAISWNRAW